MTAINLNATVGQLVVERPGRARIFEQFGIDYCCGGKKPLVEACHNRGVEPEVVLAALTRAEQQSRHSDLHDWSTSPLGELANHIVESHHAYLREELPRLAGFLDRVVRAHGQRHPDMIECRAVFMAFREELESHMMKEEQILFPLIRQIESSVSSQAFHCGSIAGPIQVMEAEHDSAGSALEKMRFLTNQYTPPADACNTFRALLDGLDQLEADMHQHVHKENNIPFPRALECERNASIA